MSRSERAEFSETPTRFILPLPVLRFCDPALDPAPRMLALCGSAWPRPKWDRACDFVRSQLPAHVCIVRAWDMNLDHMLERSDRHRREDPSGKILFMCSNDLFLIDALERCASVRETWRALLVELSACLCIPVFESQSDLLENISQRAVGDDIGQAASIERVSRPEDMPIAGDRNVLVCDPSRFAESCALAASKCMRLALDGMGGAAFDDERFSTAGERIRRYEEECSDSDSDSDAGPVAELSSACAVVRRGEEQCAIEHAVPRVFVHDSRALDSRWTRLGRCVRVVRCGRTDRRAGAADALVRQFRKSVCGRACQWETCVTDSVDESVRMRRTILIEKLIRIKLNAK
jgi:hypothetical protein